MPLENRTLEPGTVLTARFKGKDRTCEVVQTEEGLRYRLDDRTEHKSPSSAGKAAMAGVACNGWRFWSLQAGAHAGNVSPQMLQRYEASPFDAARYMLIAKRGQAKTPRLPAQHLRRELMRLSVPWIAAMLDAGRSRGPSRSSSSPEAPVSHLIHTLPTRSARYLSSQTSLSCHPRAFVARR